MSKCNIQDMNGCSTFQHAVWGPKVPHGFSWVHKSLGFQDMYFLNPFTVDHLRLIHLSFICFTLDLYTSE